MDWKVLLLLVLRYQTLSFLVAGLEKPLLIRRLIVCVTGLVDRYLQFLIWIAQCLSLDILQKTLVFILVDKEVEFYSFTLSARVLEYQTAIIDGDFDRAESLLVDIPYRSFEQNCHLS